MLDRDNSEDNEEEEDIGFAIRAEENEEEISICTDDEAEDFSA